MLDSGKNLSSDDLKKKMDEAALTVKSCYWLVHNKIMLGVILI